MKAGNATDVRKILADAPTLVNSPGWVPPPLHCAVLWDQPDIIDVLLEAGADIEQKDPDRETSPLRYAIVYARPNCIRRLIERGADSGVTTDEGTTALELAINGSNGAFEEYDDLPGREAYAEVVTLLKSLGLS